MSCPVTQSERDELHEEHREILKMELNSLVTQPGHSAVNPAQGCTATPSQKVCDGCHQTSPYVEAGNGCACNRLEHLCL